MEINWFTLIAQIVNFLILVWLLKRFLYKPVLDAIDKREQKIIDQLNDAEAKKTEAIKEQEDFKQKNLNFEIERKELINKAAFEAKETRMKLLEKARLEAEELKKKLEISAMEKQKISDKAQILRIQKEVFALSRKALSDLASASLEAQVTFVFINKLKSLNEEALMQFKNAFKKDEITLKSAFSLSEEQLKQIEDQVNKLLEKNLSLKVELQADLIGGIELSTKNYKLSWSISGYLKDLEELVFEKIEEEQTESKAS